MDSLPPQPIHRLPTATQRESYTTVGRICALLAEGLSETEIVEILDLGSNEAMRIRLENWGLSNLLPPLKDQPESRVVAKKGQADPKPRPFKGGAKPLPPAANATHLFRLSIGNLQSDNEWYIQGLKETLCENSFIAEGDDSARGITPYPTDAEVRLIACYLMDARNWPAVEELIERLHPESEKAERGQIADLLVGKVKKSGERGDDALRPIARKLAKLIRGGQVGRGRNRPELSMNDQAAALMIEDGRKQGVPEEEIKLTMMEYGLSEEEYEKISKISPPRP